jgi:hypothetical protein
MRAAAIVILAVFAAIGATTAADRPAAFPKFKTQEIDAGLKIGYAVLISDINTDAKPDILVVDQFQVVWYENPSWKKRVILDGKTKPDNVCATTVDIDGDGKLDIVLGAGWKPSDTANPGTLQWLKNPGVPDKEWAMFPIPCDEPTVHRIRNFDIDSDGKPEIVHVPLQGRDATAKGNFVDGRPVRVMAYKIPANPEKPESWKPQVLSDSLYVCHNFWPIPRLTKDGVLGTEILITSYDGVHSISKLSGEWTTTKLGVGNQANPKGSRGASEVKLGRPAPIAPVIATIEPWHGNQVVVYTQPEMKVGGRQLWNRHVIDEQLRWGHAVWFANLDGEPGDELIIGVRDDPNPKAGDKHTQRRGVRIYKCTDDKGAKWERMLLDEGGVAVEDLTAGDLNGDGKIDIVACGRQTKNVRIYWNEGK